MSLLMSAAARGTAANGADSDLLAGYQRSARFNGIQAQGKGVAA